MDERDLNRCRRAGGGPATDAVAGVGWAGRTGPGGVTIGKRPPHAGGRAAMDVCVGGRSQRPSRRIRGAGMDVCVRHRRRRPYLPDPSVAMDVCRRVHARRDRRQVDRRPGRPAPTARAINNGHGSRVSHTSLRAGDPAPRGSVDSGQSLAGPQRAGAEVQAVHLTPATGQRWTFACRRAAWPRRPLLARPRPAGVGRGSAPAGAKPRPAPRRRRSANVEHGRSAQRGRRRPNGARAAARRLADLRQALGSVGSSV